MASSKLNDMFTRELINSDPLDIAIDFISDQLEPEDVFSESKLQDWAENNGYVKAETE